MGMVSCGTVPRRCHMPWYVYGMRVPIDKAGRMVIPKSLRDQVGLLPGEVEVAVVGAGLRIEPLSASELGEEDGHLVIPASGVKVDDQLVQVLRRADQR